MWHPDYCRAQQKGWSLIETTLAVAVLSVVATYVFSLLLYAQRTETVQQDGVAVSALQNTVQGAALARLAMPRPDEARPSPERPGYLEGWLPSSGVTLSSQGARVRYLVNENLVNSSGVIYQPDGARLLGDLLPARTQRGALDFCYALLQEEQNGRGFPDGQRVAYGLQRPLSGGSSAPTQWVDATNAAAAQQLDTRLLGYTELVSDLGCLELMNTLTAEIKAAAVYVDLGKLAEINLRLRQMIRDYSELNVALYVMREGIWNTALISSVATLGVSISNAIIAAVGGSPTVTASTLQITKGLLIIATNEEYVRRTTIYLGEEKANLLRQEKKLADARAYLDKLNAELTARVAKVTQLQQGGLR